MEIEISKRVQDKHFFINNSTVNMLLVLVK